MTDYGRISNIKYGKYANIDTPIKSDYPRITYPVYNRAIDERVYKQIVNERYGVPSASRYHEIIKVIFNEPATIVFWDDGTKTVVKALPGEEFDPEKGLAMAICKRVLGNKGNYYNEFKKWIPSDCRVKGEVDGNQ